ncbi:MAG: hypothetical protein QOH89_1269 [Pseudonocardiales bacterium]|nr:hypothetical protein [Pseudonocardiales bacterium]
MRAPSRPLALLAALALSGTALFLAAPLASAHVTVNSADAEQGGYAVLTFRVPNETDTASTTKVTVALPTGHPIASVAVQPHPGWSFTTKTTKLDPPVTTDDGEVTEAVSRITWTADSAASAIKPGEFDEFNISAGPLPAVDRLTFPTLQTYSDGKVVKWVERAAPGSTDEPAHPAPTLDLPAPGDSDGSPSSSTASPASPMVSGEAADSDAASEGAATTGIVLGGIGVVLGASALALAARRRNVS